MTRSFGRDAAANLTPDAGDRICDGVARLLEELRRRPVAPAPIPRDLGYDATVARLTRAAR